MSDLPFARLTAAALVLHSISAAAEPVELDLRGALDRAHRAAPAAVAWRCRIAEAEAGMIAADVAFTANPELEVGAGPRFTTERSIDAELRIEQDLEPWRRGPRRQLARAEVGRARGEADVERRELDLAVSLAFYEALYADRELELARRAAELASRGAAAAGRRRQAGDITDLDANLARAALGRARAAVESATADRTMAVGKLAALIGAAPDDTLALRGELRPAPAGVALPAASDRADVRALELARAAAVAEGAQAAARGRPDLGIWLGYHREDATDVVLAGLRLSLPVWNRAQGDRAIASAKAHRAGQARDATLRMANREIADALAVYADATRAVDTFEREVVPTLEDSERLLDRTLDAGQLAVSEYLLARQEILNGRREHLRHLLALAKAAVIARHVGAVSP